MSDRTANNESETGRRNGRRSGRGFGAYYARHLAEHRDPVNRKYHFLGTGSAILLLVHFGCSGRMWLLPLVPLAYYGFSLYGHRRVEKNEHSTFRNPLYNILGDLRMFWAVFSQELTIH